MLKAILTTCYQLQGSDTEGCGERKKVAQWLCLVPVPGGVSGLPVLALSVPVKQVSQLFFQLHAGIQQDLAPCCTQRFSHGLVLSFFFTAICDCFQKV